LTIPYWYYVNQIATTPNALSTTANQAALAIYIVSAAILIAVCICGVLGATLRHIKLLLIVSRLFRLAAHFRNLQVLT